MRRPEIPPFKSYQLGGLNPPGMKQIYVEGLGDETWVQMVCITYADGSARLMSLNEYLYYYEAYLFPVGPGASQARRKVR